MCTLFVIQWHFIVGGDRHRDATKTRAHWDRLLYLCSKAITINPDSTTESRGNWCNSSRKQQWCVRWKSPSFTCMLFSEGLCSRDLMTFSDLHSHRSTDGPDLPLQRAHACLPCVPTNTFTHNHSVITAATAGPGPCIDCFLADNHPKISNLWGN